MPNTKNIKLITEECKKQGLSKYQAAYVLATVQHETNNTFEPVEEGYYLKNPLAFQKTLRYYPYFGRGYVQLTWKDNYEKFNVILGVKGTGNDLVKYPNVVMREPVSRFILVYGMRTGTFTGKRLSNFITDAKQDYKGARQIINGRDKDTLIAGYALLWLKSKEIREVYHG
jgi:predicted chitinase